MRARRQKQYKRLMAKYCTSFGFREPYQVLIDAAIIQDAARYKMRLGSLLENTLLAKEIKPMITQCCIRHLYDAPATTPAEKQQKDAWIEVAKAAERRRCGHHELERPLSALECLMSVVDPKGSKTNKNHYIVTTQDQEVRQRLREIAGVPLVYINRSVMILEPMAAKSEQVRESDEKGKIRAGLKGSRPAGAGAKRKREDEIDDDEDMPEQAKAIAAAEAKDGRLEAQNEPTQKKRKTKGPKGPNPLSVKKTKKEREKPVARQVEEERSTIRKAAKQDPQEAEEALDAEAAADQGVADGVKDGPRKRKRKRKAREGHSVTNGEDADVRAEEAAEAVMA